MMSWWHPTIHRYIRNGHSRYVLDNAGIWEALFVVVSFGRRPLHLSLPHEECNWFREHSRTYIAVQKIRDTKLLQNNLEKKRFEVGKMLGFVYLFKLWKVVLNDLRLDLTGEVVSCRSVDWTNLLRTGYSQCLHLRRKVELLLMQKFSLK